MLTIAKMSNIAIVSMQFIYVLITYLSKLPSSQQQLPIHPTLLESSHFAPYFIFRNSPSVDASISTTSRHQGQSTSHQSDSSVDFTKQETTAAMAPALNTAHTQQRETATSKQSLLDHMYDLCRHRQEKLSQSTSKTRVLPKFNSISPPLPHTDDNIDNIHSYAIPFGPQQPNEFDMQLFPHIQTKSPLMTTFHGYDGFLPKKERQVIQFETISQSYDVIPLCKLIDMSIDDHNDGQCDTQRHDSTDKQQCNQNDISCCQKESNEGGDCCAGKSLDKEAICDTTATTTATTTAPNIQVLYPGEILFGWLNSCIFSPFCTPIHVTPAALFFTQTSMKTDDLDAHFRRTHTITNSKVFHHNIASTTTTSSSSSSSQYLPRYLPIGTKMSICFDCREILACQVTTADAQNASINRLIPTLQALCVDDTLTNTLSASSQLPTNMELSQNAQRFNNHNHHDGDNDDGDDNDNNVGLNVHLPLNLAILHDQLDECVPPLLHDDDHTHNVNNNDTNKHHNDLLTDPQDDIYDLLMQAASDPQETQPKDNIPALQLNQRSISITKHASQDAIIDYDASTHQQQQQQQQQQKQQQQQQQRHHTNNNISQTRSRNNIRLASITHLHPEHAPWAHHVIIPDASLTQTNDQPPLLPASNPSLNSPHTSSFSQTNGAFSSSQHLLSHSLDQVAAAFIEPPSFDEGSAQPSTTPMADTIPQDDDSSAQLLTSNPPFIHAADFISIASSFSLQSMSSNSEIAHRNLNTHLTTELELLEQIYNTRRLPGDQWRSSGFRKAVGILRSLDYRIETPAQVSALISVLDITPAKTDENTNQPQSFNLQEQISDQTTPQVQVDDEEDSDDINGDSDDNDHDGDSNDFPNTNNTSITPQLEEGNVIPQKRPQPFTDQALTAPTSPSTTNPPRRFIKRSRRPDLSIPSQFDNQLTTIIPTTAELAHNNRHFRKRTGKRGFGSGIATICIEILQKGHSQRYIQLVNQIEQRYISDLTTVHGIGPCFAWGLVQQMLNHPVVLSIGIGLGTIRCQAGFTQPFFLEQWRRLWKCNQYLLPHPQWVETVTNSYLEHNQYLSPQDLLSSSAMVSAAAVASSACSSSQERAIHTFSSTKNSINNNLAAHTGATTTYTLQNGHLVPSTHSSKTPPTSALSSSQQPLPTLSSLSPRQIRAIYYTLFSGTSSLPSLEEIATVAAFLTCSPPNLFFFPFIPNAVLYEDYDQYLLDSTRYTGITQQSIHPFTLPWLFFTSLRLRLVSSQKLQIPSHFHNNDSTLPPWVPFVPPHARRLHAGLASYLLLYSLLFSSPTITAPTSPFPYMVCNEAPFPPPIDIAYNIDQNYDPVGATQAFFKNTSKTVQHPIQTHNFNTITHAKSPTASHQSTFPAPSFTARSCLMKQHAVGLLFRQDHIERISRAQVTAVDAYIQAVARMICPSAIVLCCGSYRRGKEHSGDIDIFITSTDWCGEDETLLVRSILLRCFLIALQIFNTPFFLSAEQIAYLLLTTDNAYMARFIYYLASSDDTKWIFHAFDIGTSNFIRQYEAYINSNDDGSHDNNDLMMNPAQFQTSGEEGWVLLHGKSCPQVPKALAAFIIQLFSPQNLHFPPNCSHSNPSNNPSSPYSTLTSFHDYATQTISFHNLAPSTPFITGALRGYFPDPKQWCCGGPLLAGSGVPIPNSSPGHEASFLHLLDILQLSPESSIERGHDDQSMAKNALSAKAKNRYFWRVGLPSLQKLDLGMFSALKHHVIDQFCQNIDMCQIDRNMTKPDPSLVKLDPTQPITPSQHHDPIQHIGPLQPTAEIPDFPTNSSSVKPRHSESRDIPPLPSLDTTWMGFCRLPPWNKYTNNRNIRIDIKLFPIESLPFALLYFTGSDHFNRSMRYYAHRNGWSLSEHNLVPVFRAKTTKNAKAASVLSGPAVFCQTEQDVFNALQLQYVHPWERNTYNAAMNNNNNQPGQ